MSWVHRVAATAAILAAISSADTITVCWDGSGDYVTIQEGIDAAVDGDEVIVCDGTYTGVGNKNLDFHGKAITVRSANGPENCIIDCEREGRGFYFHSGEAATSVVDGFTIRHGYPLFGNGGAIYCDFSSPTISNCTITQNSAGDGGGVFCAYGSPTITGCAITDNTADCEGSGIQCWNASPTITNCVVARNTAYG